MIWIAYSVALTLALFLFFAVLGTIRDKYGKDHPLFKILVVPFVLCDIAYNDTIAVFLFFDLPAKLDETLSQRLKRYIRTDKGWRNKLALWFCVNLIEKIDPGHCR